MSVTITYNGLTITSDGTDYTITKASGLSGLDNRVSQIDLLSRDGGRVFDRKDSMRSIILEGIITGITEAGFFTKKAALLEAFNNKATSDLDITLWDGTNRKIPAKVVQEPQPEYIGGFTTRARFQIILRCDDPYWLDTASGSATLYLEEVIGFDLPVDLPFDIVGGGSIDTAVINNTGAIDIYPTVTINASATLTNPTITNQTTGESFQINTTLNAGDSVVVSWGTSGESVVYNGSTNYYQYLLGNLFKLQSGNNSIRFSATTYDGNSTAVVSYNIAYRDF